MFADAYRLLLNFLRRLRRVVRLLLYLAAFTGLMGSSTILASDKTASIRRFTRPVEFDFVDWSLDAALLKVGQVSLGTVKYVPVDKRPQIVLDYFALVQQTWEKEAAINTLFADPQVSDPEAASAGLRQELAALTQEREALRPLAESVLEAQVSQVAAELGLTLGGQPAPPVLYHTTDPPNALIVSPREVIRQEHSMMISPEMNIEQTIALENAVAEELDVSTLVVGIGGIGMYPTMVMETTNINWLAEVVSHEWIHNYLMLRPLGLLYDITPDNRIINETTASIAGKEMARELVARYYPEYLPPPPSETSPAAPPAADEKPAEPPPFNFNAEMRTTRLEAEALLEQGKIEEAEAYMEARRVFFWDQGYRIRKLNQAYFAFYGAYADQPGGAAGEDPVSAAVRRLRAGSPSLAAFINRIAWIVTYEQLIQISPAE